MLQNTAPLFLPRYQSDSKELKVRQRVAAATKALEQVQMSQVCIFILSVRKFPREFANSNPASAFQGSGQKGLL